MQPRYPIRAVSKITGISLDTLRAWERRYQAVVPERSERGRQYGGPHIERLLLLRQLVDKGHAIGGIASLPDEKLKDLLLPPVGPPHSQPEQSPAILTPILAAIERFDSARAADELSRLAAVLTPRDVVYRLAVPLMREVGDRCHNGTLTIAQEHLVSEMLRNLLGGMLRLFRPNEPAIKMILATPAGEGHDFGILAAAMLTAINGTEPVYLGADLPAAEIANAARQVHAQVILLGITLITETTPGEVAKLAAAMPEESELWIGGARSHQLDLANLGRKVVLVPDLPAFENECRSKK